MEIQKSSLRIPNNLKIILHELAKLNGITPKSFEDYDDFLMYMVDVLYDIDINFFEDLRLNDIEINELKEFVLYIIEGKRLLLRLINSQQLHDSYDRIELKESIHRLYDYYEYLKKKSSSININKRNYEQI